MFLPTPPTDNLYKFTFTAGIVIALVSLNAMSERSTFLIEQGAILREEENVVDDQKDLIRTLETAFDHEYDYYCRLVGYPKPKPDDSITVIPEPDYAIPEQVKVHSDVESAYDRISELVQTRNERVVRLNAKLDKHATLTAMQDREHRRARILVWIGVVMTLAGGVLWYMLVQRFQDRILKKDANK